MRKNVINVMTGILLATMVSLVGCGGVGDGATPTTPTPVGTTVSLSAFKSVFLGTSSGASYNFSTLVGTDLQGNTWTGSHSLIADGATTFENQNITRSRALLNIHSGNSITTDLTSMYFQITDHSIYKIIADPDIVFVPSTQTSLPDNPKVGDSGILGSFTSSVATPTTMTWALNSDFNGASVLVLSSSFKTGSTGSTGSTATEVYNYYLDASGVPTKVTIRLNNGTTTVTLSGNRT